MVAHHGPFGKPGQCPNPWGRPAWHTSRMPPLIPRNPIAASILAYDLWRKLPPAQRKLLLDAARAHGPRVAAAAAAAVKARKRP